MNEKLIKKEIRRLASVRSPFNRDLNIGELDGLTEIEGDHIERYIRSKGGEVYGSFAAKSYSPYAARDPEDVDAAVPNPRNAANYIRNLLSRRRDSRNVRISENRQYGTFRVEIYEHGEWRVIADLQSLREHQNQRFNHIGSVSKSPVKTPRGTYRQNEGDQLLRKANSFYQGFDGREHREEKDKRDLAAGVRLALDSEQYYKDQRTPIGNLFKPDNDYERLMISKFVDEELNSVEASRAFLLIDPIPQSFEQKAAYEKNKQYSRKAGGSNQNRNQKPLSRNSSYRRSGR